MKRDIIRTAPFFALSLLLGLVTVWFQLHEILKGEAEPTDPFLVRVLGGGYAIWFYLAKAIVPTKLSMVYPRWEIDAAGFVWYLPAVLWIAALIIFWRFRHTWGRPFLFGLGYFTIALLPVLGIFPMDYLRFSQVADHLAYIALPGAIALVVGLSVVVLKRHLAFSASQPFGLRCALAVPVVVLSILTWKQSSVYVNEETLWRDTIKKNPSGWIGYHNLADTLAELRRYEEATYYYQQSLQLEPTYAKTHNNLGNCLFFLGKLDDAVEQFMDAVKDKPELAEAHHNLGMAHYKRKQYAEALAAFQKAIELQPDYASAYSGAGNTELQFGRVAEALDHYFNAAKYNPDGSDIQYNIGIILSARGETNAAVHFLKRALRLRPDDELARQELNLLLASTDVSQ